MMLTVLHNSSVQHSRSVAEEAHPQSCSTHTYTYTKHTGTAHKTRHSISVSIFIAGVFLGMTDIMKELCPAALRMDGASYFKLLHSSSQKRKFCSMQAKA